jgi:diguanylate cyclase (GGDEF)-like protein
VKIVAWRLVLVAGLSLAGLYFLVPGVAGKDFTYLAIGITSTACLLIGVRLRQPADPRAWYLLASANACFVAGDAVNDVYDLILHSAAPFPSVADALYLSGYPLLFAGIFRISGARSAPGSRESRADAAIVCTGGLALSWQLLMGSYARDSTLSAFGKLVTMAYPVMDLGVLFIVIVGLLSGAARRPTDTLIISAVIAMLVADTGYDILVLHGAYAVGNPIDSAFLVNYALLGVAGLHPSVAQQVVTVSSDRPQRRSWMPLVAVAGFVSPVILLTASLNGWHVDVSVLAVTSLLLFGLVVTRVSWLFGRISAQNNLLSEQSAELHSALESQHALEQDLRHQAFHDSLTGLANRALLHDRISHALATSVRSTGIVALCLCDLDGFKGVNDSLGHGAGDELLVIAAKRLASIVRSGDTVARLGGDEFAILLDDIDDPGAASALAERIVSVLRQPMLIGDRQLNLSASVGVALAEVGSTTERLLSDADAAMYEAKAAGKDRVSQFQTSMRSRILDELTLRGSFADALQSSEFFLQYQPQLCLRDGSLEGFEALVRWRHPELGVVAPDRFIGLAEDSGFIVPLGRWILDTACAQAASWSEISPHPLSVSVNLSARQLQDPNLMQDVQAALSYSGLPPEQLVLEITETVLMLKPTHAAQVLAQFRELGIRIALDDFGTGYSSLSYLRQFPVDILKIDKSFIDPLDDPASEGTPFVKTILRLARDLNLSTTAEGIERPGQRTILAELHCDSAQGYLLSRPLDPEAALAYISKATAVVVENASGGPGSQVW